MEIGETMVNRALFTSYNTDERTPDNLYKELDREFKFTMDVSPLHSLVDMTIDSVSWDGNVYCNPPYNQQDEFLRKALSELQLKNVNRVVFLLPSRTDTKRFHEMILPFAKDIRFIKGRLKFSDHTNSAPFPSMIVVF